MHEQEQYLQDVSKQNYLRWQRGFVSGLCCGAILLAGVLVLL